MDCTSCTARARIAGSSANGMPALTSSMCAPASTWARASASTRLKSPAAISAARILRSVGMMRSPMMTKGRSKPPTTSLVAELMTVSVIKRSSSLSGPLGDWGCVAARIPGGAALKYAGSIHDLGHRFFLAVGHDVHAADAGDLADLLDQLDAEIAALARLILRSLKPRNDAVRNMHAWHVLAHPLGRLRRAQRTDAREDEDLAGKAKL